MSIKFLTLFLGLSCFIVVEGNAKQYNCYDKSTGVFRGTTAGLSGKNSVQITNLCNSDPTLKLKCNDNCTDHGSVKKKSGFF
jgi:hypothetical protein